MEKGAFRDRAQVGKACYLFPPALAGYSVKYSTILNPIRLKSEDALPRLTEPLSEDSGEMSTQSQSASWESMLLIFTCFSWKMDRPLL